MFRILEKIECIDAQGCETYLTKNRLYTVLANQSGNKVQIECNTGFNHAFFASRFKRVEAMNVSEINELLFERLLEEANKGEQASVELFEKFPDKFERKLVGNTFNSSWQDINNSNILFIERKAKRYRHLLSLLAFILNLG